LVLFFLVIGIGSEHKGYKQKSFPCTSLMSLKDVLLVETDKMFKDGVVKALSSKYSVSVVDDHNRGLRSLRDNLFSVVVNGFPREDSNLIFIDFCKKLYPNVPMINYSFNPSEDFMTKCYDLGVSSFVFKSQSLSDLVKAVDYYTRT
jgi:DNA-binding NarL/FixJ family response regulator